MSLLIWDDDSFFFQQPFGCLGSLWRILEVQFLKRNFFLKLAILYIKNLNKIKNKKIKIEFHTYFIPLDEPQ